MIKKREKKIRVTIQVERELVDKIDILADKYNLTRSQLMRNMLEMGYDDAHMLESVGILPVVHFGINVFERFKESLKAGNVKIEDGKANFPIT